MTPCSLGHRYQRVAEIGCFRNYTKKTTRLHKQGCRNLETGSMTDSFARFTWNSTISSHIIRLPSVRCSGVNLERVIGLRNRQRTETVT